MFWTDYFLNEKRRFLEATGMTREQIIAKYENDYNEYSKNATAWCNSRDRVSFLLSQRGLLEAIEIIKKEVTA